jgi:hypothetical protein
VSIKKRGAEAPPLVALAVIYFFLFSRCDKALPAAVLLVFEVLPSRRTLDAALAALELVTFLAITLKIFIRSCITRFERSLFYAELFCFKGFLTFVLIRHAKKSLSQARAQFQSGFFYSHSYKFSKVIR